jgi:hypothetical protein
MRIFCPECGQLDDLGLGIFLLYGWGVPEKSPCIDCYMIKNPPKFSEPIRTKRTNGLYNLNLIKGEANGFYSHCYPND